MNEPNSTYNPRRFRTTVPFYARYRLGYPESLISRVVEIVGLQHGDKVMDLGCGPGLLAIPFARAGMKVLAVDPEPEMLQAARQAVAAAGVPVTLRQGSSFDLPSDAGTFRLVTMGRSFHWMDRAATLAALDRLVTQDGALAFFDDEHPRTAENAWRLAVRDVANAYGRRESPHLVDRATPQHRTHESLLLDSAFSRLERIAVFVKRDLTPDEIVGLASSLSSTLREKLGDRADTFEAELRARLEDLSPEGHFTEIAEVSALIAKRPRSPS